MNHIIAVLAVCMTLGSCSTLIDSMTSLDEITTDQKVQLESVKNSLGSNDDNSLLSQLKATRSGIEELAESKERPSLSSIDSGLQRMQMSLGDVHKALVGQNSIRAELQTTNEAIAALSGPPSGSSLKSLETWLIKMSEALSPGPNSVHSMLEATQVSVERLSGDDRKASISDVNESIKGLKETLAAILGAVKSVNGPLNQIVTNTDSLVWQTGTETGTSILEDVHDGTMTIASLVPESPWLAILFGLFVLIGALVLISPGLGASKERASNALGTITILAITAVILFALEKGTLDSSQQWVFWFILGAFGLGILSQLIGGLRAHLEKRNILLQQIENQSKERADSVLRKLNLLVQRSQNKSKERHESAEEKAEGVSQDAQVNKKADEGVAVSSSDQSEPE